MLEFFCVTQHCMSCGILKVLLRDIMWLVAHRLSWVVFTITSHILFLAVVHLSLICMPFFVFMVYVVFLSCIQVFSFMCGKYYIHNVVHMD